MRILVTGSEGLIGHHLSPALAGAGFEVVPYDRRLAGADGRALDTRDPDRLAAALDGCIGVVHLAAVSRVVWGENDPELCRAVNVGGTRNLCEAVLASPDRPFVVFGSSREVYGLPAALPVEEDAPLAPCNVYGETKVEGERLIRELGAAGAATAILRFSNVYGWTGDHPDRVVPAFAHAAAHGGEIRVDGADCLFDFTHIDDVVPAILAAVTQLAEGKGGLPDMHLVSGTGTTLGELAELARKASGGRLAVREAPPRDFDVARFTGDPSRAAAHLGWAARTGIAEGMARLTEDFRRLEAAAVPAGAPQG